MELEKNIEQNQNIEQKQQQNEVIEKKLCALEVLRVLEKKMNFSLISFFLGLGSGMLFSTDLIFLFIIFFVGAVGYVTYELMKDNNFIKYLKEKYGI